MPETFGEVDDVEAMLRFAPPETYAALTSELLARGYGEDAVSSILGANWYRVASRVWRG